MKRCKDLVPGDIVYSIFGQINSNNLNCDIVRIAKIRFKRNRHLKIIFRGGWTRISDSYDVVVYKNLSITNFYVESPSIESILDAYDEWEGKTLTRDQLLTIINNSLNECTIYQQSGAEWTCETCQGNSN